MSKDDKIVFCTGGGCTAKLGAGVLSRILEKLPRGEKDPDLLVGYDSRDDAAVYRITDNIALVQTVDFFSADGGRPLYLWANRCHKRPERCLRHGRRGKDCLKSGLLPGGYGLERAG